MSADHTSIRHTESTPQEPFDPSSGSLLERLLFGNRPIIVALCLVGTLLLAFSAHK
jgi:hypothetical protein